MSEVIRDEQDNDNEEPTENGDTDGNSTSPTNNSSRADDDTDDDYDRKSENAVDYSDINELAEDLQTLMAVR